MTAARSSNGPWRCSSRCVERAFVSVRRDQSADPLRARFPQIVDTSGTTSGPIAGILAAQAQHPQAAWLVLACDLPLLDDATLQHLIARTRPGGAWRPPTAPATTACRSRCAPSMSRAAARPWPTTSPAGKHCPRKFLIQSDARLLEEPNPRALDNVNTPEEYERGRATSCGSDDARRSRRTSRCSTSRCCASRPAAARKPS